MRATLKEKKRKSSHPDSRIYSVYTSILRGQWRNCRGGGEHLDFDLWSKILLIDFDWILIIVVIRTPSKSKSVYG